MTMSEPISTEKPIHEWFGLTYANYLTVPRSVLQSMPVGWQRKLVDLLQEAGHEFGYLEWPIYEVVTLKREPEHMVYEECLICDGEGYLEENVCDGCDGEGVTECHRYETAEEVGMRTDPIPHYNRGRTRLTRASEMHSDDLD